jgi:hypothetical protein
VSDRAPDTPVIDFDALTRAQLDTLSQIAIGNDSGHHPRVLARLLEMGLVQRFDQNVYGRGSSPIDRIPVVIHRYEMPIWAHIQWAEWCERWVAQHGGKEAEL